MLHLITRVPFDLTLTSGLCDHRSAGPIGETLRCGALGSQITAAGLPRGRSDVTACRCPKHGGADEARKLVFASWSLQAPASVGGDLAVQEAGTATLTSEHGHVVVRPVDCPAYIGGVRMELSADAQARLRERHSDRALRHVDLLRAAKTVAPHRWRRKAQILAIHLGGVIPDGSSPRQDANAETLHALTQGPDPLLTVQNVPPRPAGIRWAYGIGIGSRHRELGIVDTQSLATILAVSEWRRGLDERIGTIKALRGGTLDWGLPVEPLTEPRVLILAPGESAWDRLADDGGPA